LASSAEEKQQHDHRRPLICLACGNPLEEPLARLGSLRCMDCRELDRRLDPQLVRDLQAND
jgi:hypothetical protein